MRNSCLAGMLVAALIGAGATSTQAAPTSGPTQEEPAATLHPAEYLRRAAKLLRSGEYDKAVFWFYVGQLRYRVYLAARPDLPKDGEPALFSSLMDVVGKPVNRYAFGDIPALARTVDEVLAWDAAAPDGLTPKSKFENERASVRAGLAAMRNEMLASADDIRATRIKNGLENRR
jgi:hypothetical protein